MDEPTTNDAQNAWFIYGHKNPQGQLQEVLKRKAPSWRDFANEKRRSAYKFQIDDKAKKVVNAAIYLRRPLLVTGDPGTGKSSLAYAIAAELGLGTVIEWPITSRSNLGDALYRYDAIGRLQAANLAKGAPLLPRSPQAANAVDVGRRSKKTPSSGQAAEDVPIEQFLTLGPLGTALADSVDKPRVLLIDEIDKSDIDLPNDLLFLFEEGKFEIPELVRLTGRLTGQQEQDGGSRQRSFAIRKHNAHFDGDPGEETVDIPDGLVTCHHFPIVVMTSNGEREMPAPFLRRCLSLKMERPNRKMLEDIVAAHFEEQATPGVQDFIDHILNLRKQNELVATDQLMNAVYVAQQIVMENRGVGEQKALSEPEAKMIQEIVLQAIGGTS